MNRELYEALRSTGIEDRHAADVSEAVSGDIVELKSDLKLLKWMVRFKLILSVGLLSVVLEILSINQPGRREGSGMTHAQGCKKPSTE